MPYVPPEYPAGHIAAVCWSADAVAVGLVVDEVCVWDEVGVFGVVVDDPVTLHDSLPEGFVVGSDDACVWLYGLCVYAHRSGGGGTGWIRTSDAIERIGYRPVLCPLSVTHPAARVSRSEPVSVLAVTAYLYPRPGCPKIAHRVCRGCYWPLLAWC